MKSQKALIYTLTLLLVSALSISVWVLCSNISAAKKVPDTISVGIINYKIFGQTEEDCVLSWDSSRVEIDQWCLKKMTQNEPETKGTMKFVTLHLGTPDTPKQYLLTFYRTYAEQDLTENWDEISKYISFQNSKQQEGSTEA